MIFITVGTQFAFDRLIQALDTLAPKVFKNMDVFAQIGESNYTPEHIRWTAHMEKQAFEQMVKNAHFLIGHAGMGTITAALEYNKPLLVMPRLKRYGEVVNDHQVAIAAEFEKKGHLLAAFSEDQLPEKIEKLQHFTPLQRQADPQKVSERIKMYLEDLHK